MGLPMRESPLAWKRRSWELPLGEAGLKLIEEQSPDLDFILDGDCPTWVGLRCSSGYASSPTSRLSF